VGPWCTATPVFRVHLQQTLGDQNWIVEYVRSFWSWQINWHLLHKTSQMWHMIDDSIQWVVARGKIMSLDNTCHAHSWSRLVWSWNVPIVTFFMPCIAVVWYSQNWGEIFLMWRTHYFLFRVQKRQPANFVQLLNKWLAESHIFRSCTNSHIFIFWNML
jgi:hypothetical protein